jgi:metallo-beta-lactamase family protein
MTANQAKEIWLVDKTKKKLKNSIEFLGFATQGVTGSSYLVNFEGKKILIECGGVQTNNLEKDYQSNSQQFRFKAKDLDYAIVNHGHIDHLMLIPKVVREGFEGKIIIPRGNKEIMKILLEDSAHIIEKDCEYLNKSRGKKYKPIYEKCDVEKTMSLVVEFDFENKYILDESIAFTFLPSQHIMNSAQLLLELKNKKKTTRVLYTSDLGNVKFGSSLYTTDLIKVEQADIVIGETTYCSEERSAKHFKERDRDIQVLKTIIDQFVIDNHSRVLIPVFANHRCQVMLKLIYDLYKDSEADFDVIIDSPMAIRITKYYSELLQGAEKRLYDEMLSWGRLKFIDGYDASVACIGDSRPKVILSASGMLSAGRATNHLAHIIEDSRSAVLLCGYASPNTLAGMIKDPRNATLKISGTDYKNKVQLYSLKTMSSHMQYSDLLDYYSSINCNEIYLVHGNSDKYKFAQVLQDRYSDELKSTKVFIPLLNDIIEI